MSRWSLIMITRFLVCLAILIPSLSCRQNAQEVESGTMDVITPTIPLVFELYVAINYKWLRDGTAIEDKSDKLAQLNLDFEIERLGYKEIEERERNSFAAQCLIPVLKAQLSADIFDDEIYSEYINSIQIQRDEVNTRQLAYDVAVNTRIRAGDIVETKTAWENRHLDLEESFRMYLPHFKQAAGFKLADLSEDSFDGLENPDLCKQYFKTFFTPPATPQRSNNICNSSNLKVPLSDPASPNCTCTGGGTGEYLKLEVKHVDSYFRTYQCVNAGHIPPIVDPELAACNPLTGFNSLEEMNTSCYCEPSIRHKVERTTGGNKYYCQNDPNVPPTGNNTNNKTYEIYFAIDQSDGCNQLSIPGGNLLPTTTPVIKELSVAPQIGGKIPGFSHNCAKVHGGISCGVISASPKVSAFREIDESSRERDTFEHRTLNHNYCGSGNGTTPPPPPPTEGCVNYDGGNQGPDGDNTCGPDGKNVNQCLTGAGGEKFLCTYSAPDYIWLNCGSTCP